MSCRPSFLAFRSSSAQTPGPRGQTRTFGFKAQRADLRGALLRYRGSSSGNTPRSLHLRWRPFSGPEPPGGRERGPAGRAGVRSHH
ncbi:hypothetical protein NDU88_006338 [Pleurodeles waltl]|uniref:Uncharacterized protein n=1 Tax=Pleurodeles waltl TaxID=8319 RepID=A0AAV7SPG9_PLEWA|nr:hypothetical protein NDU88_006338 [Pleurodeles waltl]